MPGPPKSQGVVVVNGYVVHESNVRNKDVDGEACADGYRDNDFSEDPVEALCKVRATAGKNSGLRPGRVQRALQCRNARHVPPTLVLQRDCVDMPMSQPMGQVVCFCTWPRPCRGLM